MYNLGYTICNYRMFWFAIFKEKAAKFVIMDLIRFLRKEQALYDKAHISQ